MKQFDLPESVTLAAAQGNLEGINYSTNKIIGYINSTV
jgi:hypothetical protein